MALINLSDFNESIRNAQGGSTQAPNLTSIMNERFSSLLSEARIGWFALSLIALGLVGSAGASAILSQLTPAKESATVAYDRGSPSLGTAEILAAMEAGLPVR